MKVDYQDGRSATTTYNPDSTVKTQTTRDGLTLTYTYDAANRPLSVVPSGSGGEHLAPLDGGNLTKWDELSRPTLQSRGDSRLSVAYPTYDLGSRPQEEKVGEREALGWAWDIYNRPTETRLPAGIGSTGDAFAGFVRSYNSLGQLVDIGALGGEPQTVPLGATWAWSGSGRLWGMTTKGNLGTAVRFGYLGGDGAQPPSGGADWKLGTMTWGSMPGADPVNSATSPPDEIWGRFGFGYRGNQGDPRDGAKIGRQAIGVGEDLFAGLGWSWGYDAGVRLNEAKAGRGSLTGEAKGPAFRYECGQGDELHQIVDETSGKVTGIVTGAYGRIVSRNGAAFSYDQNGRRTEDDRFSYLWNWRGELIEVTVKEGWGSAFEGHLVRYEYDALGRLFARNHLSPPAEADGVRNLLERRVYVWEGQSLLVEAGFADQDETQMLWRKTYVPGPSGLDDAVQVKVDNLSAPGIAGTRLYTYLRDELGTVIGVVGEEENNDPNSPNISARYLYSPYGEAHIEKALEVREVRFEEADNELNDQVQEIEDPELQSEGALTVTFSAALDASLV